MLLRRLVLCGLAAKQGLPRPLAAAPFTSDASNRAPDDGKDSLKSADALLAYWRGLLDDRQRPPAGIGLRDDDVRALLHTALRVRAGKAQSSLPEQMMGVFMRYYEQLDAEDRLALLRGLTAGFGVQAGEVDAAADAWHALRAHQQAGAAAAPGNVATPGPGPDLLLRAAGALRAATTPLYARLFVPLSQQAGGIKFLSDLRADLLQAIQAQPAGAGPMRALADALRDCLAEWFSVGLLRLERISWEGSSAELLEKVAAGEAVHAFCSWQDLKGRLDARTRRVYAFMHSAMPGEPLVVLHTALTHGVARSMQQLLPAAAREARLLHVGGQHHTRLPPSDRTWEDQQHGAAAHVPGAAGAGHGEQHGADADAPTTAVFYSISATQQGLAGVDLGNFLIKQVAHCVQAEFPSVHTLCTLSPLPGFASWLRLQLARVEQQLLSAVPLPLLLPDDAAELEAVAMGHLPARAQQAQPQSDADAVEAPEIVAEKAAQRRAAALLLWALADDAWLHSTRVEVALQRPLLRLATHYLLKERRRVLALDPVANFHLRNGAAVLQLNWRADTSDAGLARSHGIMVNYQYELDRLADNNRAYVVDGAVTASPAVRALLGEG